MQQQISEIEYYEIPISQTLRVTWEVGICKACKRKYDPKWPKQMYCDSCRTSQVTIRTHPCHRARINFTPGRLAEMIHPKTLKALSVASERRLNTVIQWDCFGSLPSHKPLIAAISDFLKLSPQDFLMQLTETQETS